MSARALAVALFCISGFLVTIGECRAQSSATTGTGGGSSEQDSVLSDQQIDLMRKDLRAKKNR